MLNETVLALLVPMTPPVTWINSYSPPPPAPIVAYAEGPSEIYDIDLAGQRWLQTNLDRDSVVEMVDRSVNASREAKAFIDRYFLEQSAFEQLENFSKLPVYWNGDDTELPSVQTISLAKTLIESLSSDQPVPQLSPSSEGEIGFAWFINDRRIEALLSPDRLLVWLWSDQSSIFPGGEELFEGVLPEALSELITKRA